MILPIHPNWSSFELFNLIGIFGSVWSPCGLNLPDPQTGPKNYIQTLIHRGNDEAPIRLTSTTTTTPTNSFLLTEPLSLNSFTRIE